MWICDPLFLNKEPVQTLHKQMDKAARIEPDPALRNRHMLVRRTFAAEEGEALAIDISADDYYKLYVNGRLVGVGPAQGYHDAYPYNTYALNDCLRAGENVVAVHVFYAGLITRAWQSGDQRQGLWFRVRDKESQTRAESDASCLTLIPDAWREKGTLGYDTQFIEDVYAESIPAGWNGLGCDTSAWRSACENPNDDHTLIPSLTPPVSIKLVSPAKIERRGESWFIDMGRETVGTLRFVAKARGKQVIEARLGEELNEDDTVRYKMRCNCDYRVWWHLSGREEDESDFFDYMAFRYAEIVDPEGLVDPWRIGVWERHYPVTGDQAAFRCGDQLINDIYTICERGVVLGAQETFVDCPSREKGQYLGDGTITAHTHLLISGDARMYKKMLLDFARSTRICKGMMAVAPGNEMQEIADYSCQFPEQVLNYYQYTGDLETVRALMPVVEGIEAYFDACRNADGLIENVVEKWNLVDWPANLRDGYDFDLSQPIGPGVHNVINAFYYGLKRDADRLRAVCGLPRRNEAEAVKAAYISAFRKADGLYRDALTSEHTALHSVVLPLYYGLTEARDVPAAVALIRERGLCCGVYMAYFALKALARNGEYQLMYDLITDQGEHSWANMLREGATSCWEAWGKDQKWNTSLCHPWASAPIILLIEDIVGLKIEKGDWGSAALEPHAPDSMGDIDLTLGGGSNRIRITRTGGVWDKQMVSRV